MKTSLPTLTAAIALTTNLFATPVQITIADGQAGNGANSPWSGTPGLGAAFEDNESEPRTQTGDKWDLEAFVFNPATGQLALIGTYDFKNGVPASGVTSGALFVKQLGSAALSHAYLFNFSTFTYSLYDSFTTIAPTDVPASTPWTINTGTAHLLGTGGFSYATGVLDPFGLGLQRASGTGHNQLMLALNLLPTAIQDSFEVHYTMSCGNDVILGRHETDRHVPDAGATAGLLGLSTLGLIGFRRQCRRP